MSEQPRIAWVVASDGCVHEAYLTEHPDGGWAPPAPRRYWITDGDWFWKKSEALASALRSARADREAARAVLNEIYNRIDELDTQMQRLQETEP